MGPNLIVLDRHYTLEPVSTLFGPKWSCKRLVTLQSQMFANFLDTLGSSHKVANIAPGGLLNMLRPPNLQGTLLISIPIDSDHFQLNLTSFKKLFILFIAGIRGRNFIHMCYISTLLVSHYTTEPIVTNLGRNNPDPTLSQVFAKSRIHLLSCNPRSI